MTCVSLANVLCFQENKALRDLDRILNLIKRCVFTDEIGIMMQKHVAAEACILLLCFGWISGIHLERGDLCPRLV